MQKCVVNFQADLKKLRTGRAHPSLVEHLKVDYYGSDVPLQQVANISIEDARTHRGVALGEIHGQADREGDPQVRPGPDAQ
jgi:hypothetical protein